MVVSCDSPGQCDVRAMTYVVNTHLRRQDTYRELVSNTGDGPSFGGRWKTLLTSSSRRCRHGEMTLDEDAGELGRHARPVELGLLRFGIIQSADHFTFLRDIDHASSAMIVG